MSKRSFEPRQAALEHNKARARKLRGGFEVHLAERLAEFEMLLRRESIIALRPEMMVLDIGALVLAVRHLIERQIGNLRKRLVELRRKLLFLRFERGNLGLEARDLGHERLGGGFLVALLRSADLLRRRVAPRLGRLGLLNRRAPALVERDQLSRFRRQAAPRQSAVEFLLVLADPFDVVHGRSLSASCPAGRGTRSIASTGCLGKVVPDAKAGEYRIARLRER